jgi:transposase
MYTLIATAKLNNVDPQAWLADALHRIADHPARRFKELLPWNWHAPAITHTIAA